MKKFMLLTCLLVLSAVCLAQQSGAQQADSQNPGYLIQKGMELYQNKNFTGSIECLEKALSLLPENLTVKYNLACLYSLTGNKEKALNYLDEVVSKGFGLNAGQDTDFNPVKDTPQFRKIIEKIDRMKLPLGSSSVAVRIKEKDLIPEGIAFNPMTGKFYLGSIYKGKIIEFDTSGSTRDFTGEGDNGLLSLIGMKVDAGKNHLWANSNFSETIKPEVLAKTDEHLRPKASYLFQFDLTTGSLLNKYAADDTLSHFFNDLVLTSDGKAYVTDSNTPFIYVTNGSRLEKFVQVPGAVYLNGIALSDNQEYIFAAHSGGVERINIKTRQVESLVHPDSVSLGFIDGLYYYDKSLIGIQNVNFNRVARFYLSSDERRVERFEVLEANNPEFIIPTTGVIINDEFYYIANSQLRSFDEKGKIFPSERLKDVIILKVKL